MEVNSGIKVDGVGVDDTSKIHWWRRVTSVATGKCWSFEEFSTKKMTFVRFWLIPENFSPIYSVFRLLARQAN